MLNSRLELAGRAFGLFMAGRLSQARTHLDGCADPRNTDPMMTTEIIQRRVAGLLMETSTLPPLESLPAMEPSEQADSMTLAWDLRQRAGEFSWELNGESRSAPESHSLTEVAQAAFELYERLKRYDRCAVDLLALNRRPVGDCAATLHAAVDAMVEAQQADEDRSRLTL